MHLHGALCVVCKSEGYPPFPRALLNVVEYGEGGSPGAKSVAFVLVSPSAGGPVFVLGLQFFFPGIAAALPAFEDR